MKFTKKILITAAAAAILASAWGAVPFSLSEVADLSPISSVSIYDRNGTLFHARLSPQSEWCIPIPLEQMGKWLPAVAVGVEDKRFYSHFGMDVLSVARAAFQNLAAQKVISGASTITSQVIRLSVTDKRTRDRDIPTKFIEFIQAIKLDSRLSKDKILEIYLNRAPFGGNIRGVEAASRIYFGKQAAMTSPGEACLLIGMLTAPSRFRPDTRPDNALKKRNFVIEQLREAGVFTDEQARLALSERLPSAKRSLPFRAYHYSQRLLAEAGETGAPGAANAANALNAVKIFGRIDSGLDLNIQTALENTLRSSVVTLPRNITAAAGIMDNRSNRLVGWVGNARFEMDRAWGGAPRGRNAPGSWVDCGTALRSPGSALKPFAWIAALDAGKITPGTLLSDTPIAFSGRAPRNFDLTYRGAVSARVALADSLNAPSVRVLRLAGRDNTLALMRNAGFSSLTRGANYYGDSLILGGCEVRLTDMLDAYSAIANGGERYYGSRFIARGGAARERTDFGRVFSDGAAWIISDILSDTRRLSFIARESMSFEGRKAAFKTGTSYGLRDAWTVVWTPQFTVAVWFGDPSGTGSPQLVGLNTAAPPAFRALRLASALASKNPAEKAPAWFEAPRSVELTKLCSLSGKPPVSACPSTRSDWVIKGVTNMMPCDIHSVMDGKNITSLPPELDFMVTPDGGTGETRVTRRSRIEIVSPIPDGRYIISSAAREAQKIPFRAEGGYGKLYWFVDGKFAGESMTETSRALPFLYALRPGRREVSVMDSVGNTASVRVYVATIEVRKEDILELK